MSTPEKFNALSVVTDVYLDLGVIGADEVPSASLAQDGLRRLNRLISQLKLQEFSFPFIGRQVFPIISAKNTYTIGPGGDLDTQRPQRIDGAGLLLAPTTGTFAITAISRAARTFTVAGNQTGSLPSGSEFVVAGSTGNDGSYTIVGAVYGSSTVISVSEVVPSAVVDGTIEVFGEGNSTVEIPIGLLTDDAYQAIQVKGMLNTQFVQGYYNQTFAGGLGTFWIWPKPTVATNAIVLYLDQQIDGFADLTTEYFFPPGYADLFEYGLCGRLSTPSTISNPLIIQQHQALYTAASTLVKRSNVKLNDMPTDVGLVGANGGLYNILTGNG